MYIKGERDKEREREGISYVLQQIATLILSFRQMQPNLRLWVCGMCCVSVMSCHPQRSTREAPEWGGKCSNKGINEPFKSISKLVPVCARWFGLCSPSAARRHFACAFSPNEVLMGKRLDMKEGLLFPSELLPCMLLGMNAAVLCGSDPKRLLSLPAFAMERQWAAQPS